MAAPVHQKHPPPRVRVDSGGEGVVLFWAMVWWVALESEGGVCGEDGPDGLA